MEQLGEWDSGPPRHTAVYTRQSHGEPERRVERYTRSDNVTEGAAGTLVGWEEGEDARDAGGDVLR
jgi:hypothetical protein